MRPWVGHPNYVYTPWSEERRERMRAVHRRRLGIPEGCVQIYGVFVPEEHAIPLKHWANWVRQKRGWDAAADFVRQFLANGNTIEKPSPAYKKTDWPLIEALMDEHMTREEIAEFLGVKLWYLKERMDIRHRLGESEFRSGKRQRVKYK